MSKSTGGITLFFEKCRLCFRTEGKQGIFTIKNLPQDIQQLIGITVTLNDNLPQKVCDKCVKTITRMKKLKILAFNNDKNLRVLFDDENDSPTKESPIKCNSSSSTPRIRLRSPSEDVVNPEPCTSSDKIPTLSVRKDLFAEPSLKLKIKTKRSSAERSVVSGSADDSNISTSSRKMSSDKEVKPDSVQDSKRVKIERNASHMFECTDCGKEFDQYKKFYLHQRTHSKKFMCPFDACCKMFASKSDLDKHVRTHTGEKPYKCDICDKGFTQRVTMKQHRASVHAGS